MNWRDAGLAVGSALVATLIAWHALGFSYLRPDVALSAGPWAIQSQYLIEAAREDGWFGTISRAAAPIGTHLRDVGTAGAFNLAVTGMLGLLAKGVGGIYNLLVLAGFAFTCALACLVYRRLGLSAPWAAVTSLIFTALPYHFEKLEQPFAMMYFPAALAAWLALEVVPTDGGRQTSRLWHGAALLAAIGCGLSGSGYAFQSVVIVIAATIVNGIRLRSWISMRRGALLGSLIAAIALATFAPSWWQSTQTGEAHRAGIERTAPVSSPPFDPLLLLLPHPAHRIPALAALRSAYDDRASGTTAATTSSLGMIAALGVLALLAVPILGRGRSRLPALMRTSTPLLYLTLVVAVIVGSTGMSSGLDGGLQPLPDRALPFIAFLSLLAMAGLFGAGIERLRGSHRWLTPVALITVLAFGLVDQIGTAGRAWEARHASLAVSRDQSRLFYREIESRVPSGAMIALMPSSANRMNHRPSSQFRPLEGYLDSTTLRWSSGALPDGPESRWQTLLDAFPLASQADTLAALGFSGLVVDRNGYADNARSTESALAITRLVPHVQRLDARQTYYALNQPKSERYRAYAVVPDRRWSAVRSDGTTVWIESAGESSLLLVNQAAIERECFLQLTLRTENPGLRVSLRERGTVLSTLALDPGVTKELSLYLDAAAMPRSLDLASEVSSPTGDAAASAARSFRLIMRKPPICR